MTIPKTPPESIEQLESYLVEQDMVDIGTRRPHVLAAFLKILGWSQSMQKEFGVGYKTMTINSKGEQFGDRKSLHETDQYFENKTVADAREYIVKLHDLNVELMQEIAHYPNVDYSERLSKILMYFWAVRLIIERAYKDASIEDQKYIDQWRNSTDYFSSLERYYDAHPQYDESKEWSIVLAKGNISRVDKCISFAKHLTGTSDPVAIKEIKGKVGYPGNVKGKARVVLKAGEIDLIEEGEIIVAPMTTVMFLPAMAKASAFVTDEGGITCHAAIVAREMKKPCIIGTRVGSKILKTGEMIEVDAVRGVVIRLDY